VRSLPANRATYADVTVGCGPLKIDLVAQDRPDVQVHARLRDGSWVQAMHGDGAVVLDAIGCRLLLDEIYEDLPDE
jgi:hypothetical protein